MVPTVLCYLISTSSTIYSPGGQSSAAAIATLGGVPIFTPVPVFTPVPLYSGHIPATSHRRVYATPPPILRVLRNRITDACASVSPAMLCNVQREVQSRVHMCIVAEEHHFEHGR
ncbi:hypothetical protein AVEN_156185-1 [Araneus ventricosus]|uniref:Uncharacterized protein n=1 Tax=Araneus ventricosus TaxID=182803 RepID=A0A4Y2UHR2_ARAVE|nr:hypothetical protein AVEN_146492-1 [Araneus ventricosus]GBO12649.1 hypothetical protein AVEN_156185-1 [Araneus ventricosus]